METYRQYQAVRKAVLQQISNPEGSHTYPGTKRTSPHAHDASDRSATEQTPHGQPAHGSVVLDHIILVGWDGSDDPLHPANQSTARKVCMTLTVSLIAIAVTAASAIDACGVQEYSEYFGVSKVVASLATGLFLIGFAFGSLVSGPFSETFGRNAVYMSTMLLYMIFLMAAGLAPNLPSHLVFRFFAGFFASTPLTCAGGTVADLWNPLEKTWAFPAYAVPAFVGPMTGQVIGSYIPSTIGWRWLEWIMLIFAALVLVLILLFQAETYADLILCWKASILRKETGDMRYRAPIEVDQESLAVRLKRSVSRPFQMFYHELIIVVVSLYLTIIYIILFTFLEGYVYIFGETYGLSRGLTSVCWSGMIVGNLLIALLVPYVYKKTVKSCKENNGFIAPEMRLWYTMLGGAPSVPVSLFWMGWTSRSTISIWSPLLASVLFGFGMTSIFVVSYMYLIDSYGTYSASALGFLVFTRYIVAGGVTVAGVPIYESFGVQYTLSFLGAASAIMAVVPYLLYKYGHIIRKHSKYAVNAE